MAIATADRRHPALAFPLEDGGRGYLFGDPVEYFYSVTTLLQGVPKHLERHYAKMAAELALEAFDRPSRRSSAILRAWARQGRASVEERKAAGELKTIDPAKLSDRDLAARWLKEAAQRHRDAAANRGSAVHALAEDLVLERAREAGVLLLEGRPLPDWDPALEPWMRSFVAFIQECEPEYLAAEATVFNRTEAYAGTLDAILRLPKLADRFPGAGEPRVLDYKTGTDIYPEVAQQLAAYARGEFVGIRRDWTEEPLPAGLSTTDGWCLHLQPARLRKDGTWETRYRLLPVAIGDKAWNAFLFARENYRWINETSREVLGKPVPRPGVED